MFLAYQTSKISIINKLKSGKATCIFIATIIYSLEGCVFLIALQCLSFNQRKLKIYKRRNLKALFNLCRCWISTFVGRILIKFKPSTGQLKCKADRIWSRNGTTYWSVSTMWERDRNRMTRLMIAREQRFGWRGGGLFSQ